MAASSSFTHSTNLGACIWCRIVDIGRVEGEPVIGQPTTTSTRRQQQKPHPTHQLNKRSHLNRTKQNGPSTYTIYTQTHTHTLSSAALVWVIEPGHHYTTNTNTRRDSVRRFVTTSTKPPHNTPLTPPLPNPPSIPICDLKTSEKSIVVVVVIVKRLVVLCQSHIQSTEQRIKTT